MVYLQYERIIRFHHEPGKGHYIIYFTLNERAVASMRVNQLKFRKCKT